MAFTYDLTTDTGKVRLLITDTDNSSPLFQDEEINAFLVLNDGVKRAAAAALDVIASSQALVLKVIRTLDLSTDGPSVARALREHADNLREEAEIQESGEEGGLFDYAEMVTNAFTARERLKNQVLRGQA